MADLVAHDLRELVVGGRVVAQGSPQEILAHPDSLTGRYLSRELSIQVPRLRNRPGKNRIEIRGAHGNNLKGIELSLPLGLLVCVTGVSGSGKSTLINDTLYAAAARHLYGAAAEPAPYESITGLEFDLLVALMRRAGRVIPRDALLGEAGRSDTVVGERTVDVHISHLRQKLGDEGGKLIKTVRGVGYVFAKEGA